MEMIPPPEILRKPLRVPSKTLMGPGPSNCPHRVLDALSNPVLGHLHTECIQIMDEIKEGVKYIFQTKNSVTMCVSAPEQGGMEAALSNLLEDGDVVLFGTTGLWASRAAEMAKRYNADARICQARLGSALTLEEIEVAFEAHKPQVFFIAQGDPTTGIYQPNIKEIGDLCRRNNCLFIVDVGASLGGTEFYMDAWNVDVAYTGSQYVLGAPAGITPISFSQRAIDRIMNRNSKVKVYYCDAILLGQYWGCFDTPRIYHHSIPSTLLYGLREALAIFCAQGLKSVIKRHIDCSQRLQKGVKDLGLELYVSNPENRLPTINTVKIPRGVDWMKISHYAMKKYCLEICGGMGPTAEITFRIGLMGENATTERVELVLNILHEAILNTSKVILNDDVKF